ncbi:acetylcholine receptor subunit beta-type unc-29-like [Gigantopelta aegis]|uniref:acetylcholine receptor subunit beta-type unc-29-like n=1 Tax=Gigantopelta aegis TaxID=1735272 RepID=UPI001B889D6C|nr:acetylcholine receptor subunit beta-type unc-29-like [Gigantopelta aegis]
MKIVLLCFVSFILLNVENIKAAQDKESLLHLRKYLLQNYTRQIRPSSTSPGKLPVELQVMMMSILEVDQTRQTLSSSLILVTQWIDEELTWNVDDFGGHSNISLSEEDIWTPQIMLINVAEKSTKPYVITINIEANGKVTFVMLDVFQTSCLVDISKYPFDEQTCSISFGSALDHNIWTPNDTSMVTEHGYFTSSNEWEIVDISASTIYMQLNKGNMAKFDFRLQRQWKFYVLSVILPMVLLSLLNASVFLLPVESGEKISFLISILVSYFVFVNYINDAMPKSTTPSRMAIYLVLTLCQSCMSIIINLLIIGDHFNKRSQSVRQVKVSQTAKVAPQENSVSVT